MLNYKAGRNGSARGPKARRLFLWPGENRLMHRRGSWASVSINLYQCGSIRSLDRASRPFRSNSSRRRPSRVRPALSDDRRAQAAQAQLRLGDLRRRRSTRQKTVELVERIQNEAKIRSMAHLTCVGHTADEIGGILDDLWKAGIRNVLALRGDPPGGAEPVRRHRGRLRQRRRAGRNYVARPTRLLHRRRRLSRRPSAVPQPHARPGTPQAQGRQRRQLRHHAALLRQRRLLSLPRRRPRDGHQGADHRRHHADHERRRRSSDSSSMCGAKIPHPLLLKLEAVEADPEAVHARRRRIRRPSSARTCSSTAWTACTSTR